VPQAICEGFERREEGWKKKRGRYCQYEGVLIGSVICIWARWGEEFSTRIQGYMRANGLQVGDSLDFEQAVRWLGKKVRWGGVESNKMCWVFWEFLRYIESRER
jgi:hypothetical protein